MKKGILIIVGLLVLAGVALGYKQTFLTKVTKADDQNIQPVTVDWVNGQVKSRTDKLNVIDQKLNQMSADIESISNSHIQFTDVNYNTYGTQINWAVDHQIIRGYKQSDNTFTFDPSGVIDRVHAAVMIAAAVGLTIPSAVTEAPFKDIKATDTYAPYIKAVKDAGIFHGSDGNFMPDSKLTREQMATALVNAFDLIDNGRNVVVMDLKSADPSHQANIQTLADLGITNLVPYSGNFRPKVYNTRLQLTSFLYQANQ